MTDIFDVLADSTRRDILQLLLQRADVAQGTSVSEIVDDLGISQPTVSKHLRVLRDASLVEVREDGQRRFYSLNQQPLEEVDDWLLPFFVDDLGEELMAQVESAAPLPEPVQHAAEVVGRVAASAKHALDSARKKLGV